MPGKKAGTATNCYPPATTAKSDGGNRLEPVNGLEPKWPPVRSAQAITSERWAPEPVQDAETRRLCNAMRIMCEFKNKFYGRNDGDLIGDYH